MNYDEVETITLDDAPDYRARMFFDYDTENPADRDGWVTTYLTPSRYVDVTPEGFSFADARSRLSANAFMRYLRTFHGAKGVQLYRIGDCEGFAFILPESLERADYSTDETGACETIAVEMQEYSKWSNGECYGYVVERQHRHSCEECGDEIVWREVEDGSLWGMIGFEYAQAEAREALTFSARPNQHAYAGSAT
jgi:hypothetical protein